MTAEDRADAFAAWVVAELAEARGVDVGKFVLAQVEALTASTAWPPNEKLEMLRLLPDAISARWFPPVRTAGAWDRAKLEKAGISLSQIAAYLGSVLAPARDRVAPAGGP